MEVAGPVPAGAPQHGVEGGEAAQAPPTVAQKVWKNLSSAWWVVDGFLAELFGLNAHRYDYELRQAIQQHEEYRKELKRAEERKAARERKAAEAAEGGEAGPSGEGPSVGNS